MILRKLVFFCSKCVYETLLRTHLRGTYFAFLLQAFWRGVARIIWTEEQLIQSTWCLRELLSGGSTVLYQHIYRYICWYKSQNIPNFQKPYINFPKKRFSPYKNSIYAGTKSKFSSIFKNNIYAGTYICWYNTVHTQSDLLDSVPTVSAMVPTRLHLL